MNDLEFERNRQWKLQIFLEGLQSIKSKNLNISEESKEKYEKRISEISYQNYIQLDNDTCLLGRHFIKKACVKPNLKYFF